jgi:uncharacterized protein DUF4007
MKPFNPSSVAFGRHETFPLRYGWLTKGFQAWCEYADVFEQEDATVILGVGKNMVTAIRYWMLAAQVVQVHGRGCEPTELGRAIFAEDGWDPYLEDDATLWLLHWLIASNAAEATGIFWFFNRFHKPEFTSKEVGDALRDFCRENIIVRFAESTLKHDVALILRMHESTYSDKEIPLEEGLDSPMATLGLIQPVEDTKYHESKPEFRWRLPLAPFGFAVAELFEHTGQAALPVERLSHSDGVIAAPGSVFRLTEECLIRKLEELIAWLPGHFELRETAGIHQMYKLSSIAPIEVLRQHYETRYPMEVAA